MGKVGFFGEANKENGLTSCHENEEEKLDVVAKLEEAVETYMEKHGQELARRFTDLDFSHEQTQQFLKKVEEETKEKAIRSYYEKMVKAEQEQAERTCSSLPKNQ